MFGGVAVYGIVNLAVVFVVLLLFYLLFILIGENGGYRINRMLVVGSLLAVLTITTIVSVSVYSHALQLVGDKIDDVSTKVDRFPDQIKDCANATEIVDLFNHYGIQTTTKIAGQALKIYEDVVVTLLFAFTIVVATIFLLASSPSVFTPRLRWRVFWFGMFWTLALEIICFIVMLFYDVIANAQLVMKGAGGIVGDALESCDVIWDPVFVYLFTPVTAECIQEVKTELCKIHHALTDYVGDNLSMFMMSSMSVAFLLPFLCLALGAGVYFTWPKDILVSESDDDVLVFRKGSKKQGRFEKFIPMDGSRF